MTDAMVYGLVGIATVICGYIIWSVRDEIEVD